MKTRIQHPAYRIQNEAALSPNVTPAASHGLRTQVGKAGPSSNFETALTRLGPDKSMQVVDFPHLAVVSIFSGGAKNSRILGRGMIGRGICGEFLIFELRFLIWNVEKSSARRQIAGPEAGAPSDIHPRTTARTVRTPIKTERSRMFA